MVCGTLVAILTQVLEPINLLKTLVANLVFDALPDRFGAVLREVAKTAFV